MSAPHDLLRRLHIRHPIIQAPLAGGGDTPALVAAVGEAGGIGFIGAAYLSPEKISEAAAAVRARTDRPFGINLFAPEPPVRPVDLALAIARVAPFYGELGLPIPAALPEAGFTFDQQLAACLDSGATTLSFTFGILPESAIAAVKNRGLYLIGTATTVDEAIALESAGVDAVVAQGSEAGGHRGTFAGPVAAGMIGTVALVPQTVDAVRIPVIASGGIMDGRGIAAALALGASAVQMGTAFLTCAESGISDGYRKAILDAREDGTRLTRAFSGRAARGIVNRFMESVEDPNLPPAVLPFPLQNALTRPLRTEAARRNRAEFLSLWAGQGVRMARRQTAAELIERLVSETAAAIARLASLADS